MNPAGAGTKNISRLGQNRRALFLIFVRRNLVGHVSRQQGLQLGLFCAETGGGGASIGFKPSDFPA